MFGMYRALYVVDHFQEWLTHYFALLRKLIYGLRLSPLLILTRRFDWQDKSAF